MMRHPPTHETRPERVLRFESDHSLGAVMVRPSDALATNWDRLAEARWSVLVPAGMDVRLWVEPAVASLGIDVLADLPADGLQELVLLGCPIDDDDVQSLGGLTGLRLLDLFHTDITDRAIISAVSKLRSVEWLSFTGTRIGDDGARQLGSLRELRRLSLKDTLITDHSIATIAALPHLAWLSLSGTRITDQGLLTLAEAAVLETLSISGTDVTVDGITEWWGRRPDVRLIAH